MSMQKIIFFVGLILVYITSSCQRKGEDCIYIIPQNFQGNVLIVFDQEDGKNPDYEGASRLYKIDTSGVLKTKFKTNYGLQRNSYFYQDSLGNRKSIKYVTSLSQVVGNEIFAFNSETGKNFDQQKSTDRHFEMVTITTSSNIDSIGNLRSSFMWSKLEPKN